MGRTSNSKDNARRVKRIFQFLQSVDFVPSSDLEARSDADVIMPIYYEAVMLFAEPFADDKSDNVLRTAIHANLVQLDQLLQVVPSSGPGKTQSKGGIACSKGCHFCCSIRVTTTAPVVLALASYLRKKHSADDMNSLMTRLEEYSQASSRLSPVDLLSSSRMCPLNQEGVCMGYEYRPHGCRTHHSFDVSACEQASKSGLVDAVSPQDPTRYEVQSIILRAYSDCMKCLAFDNRELEFIPALLIALSDTDAEQKYSEGEPVFESAHREDVLILQKQEMHRLGMIQLRHSQS